MVGNIKILKKNGFGFITPSNGGKDIFFHMSGLAGGLEYDELKEGDPVSFSIEVAPRGPKAIEIEVAVLQD